MPAQRRIAQVTVCCDAAWGRKCFCCWGSMVSVIGVPTPFLIWCRVACVKIGFCFFTRQHAVCCLWCCNMYQHCIMYQHVPHILSLGQLQVADGFDDCSRVSCRKSTLRAPLLDVGDLRVLQILCGVCLLGQLYSAGCCWRMCSDSWIAVFVTCYWIGTISGCSTSITNYVCSVA